MWGCTAACKAGYSDFVEEGCWKEYSLMRVSNEGFCFEVGGPAGLEDSWEGIAVEGPSGDQKLFSRSAIKLGKVCVPS